MSNVSLLYLEASYALALAVEIVQLVQPRPVLRWLALFFGGAGFFAHTLYLCVKSPPLASQVGSLLFLAWILAIFYLYGSVHHRRQAWGVFVLPLVIGIAGIA